MVDVSASQFNKLAKEEDSVIIDVRTESEHNHKKIPGSVLMEINSNDFIEKAKQLDTKKTYLVYCRTGNRSRYAINILRQQGINNIYHLANGIKEWIDEGYETQ